MRGQSQSSVQIIIGLVVGLVIIGGVLYFARNLIPQNLKNIVKAPIQKLPTESTKSSQIVQKTAETRKELTTDTVAKDTADWRQYQSSKLNFSVKFPQNVTTVTENIKTGQVSFPFVKSCTSNICEGFYINAVDVSAGIFLKDALDKGLAGPDSAAEKGANYQDITIDGIKGVETFKVEKIPGIDADGAYVLKDNKLYVLDLFTSRDKADQNIKNFNLMLKTFKFLK